MIGRTNVGGGGGSIFALIDVTYPAGSICTCSNGQKTLTAENTSGSWVFMIPEAGTWTISCTDGEDSDSKSASITTEGQIESIVLTYRLYIYDRGTQYVPLSESHGSNSSVTFGSGYISTTGPNQNGGSRISTANKLDITDYSKLIVEVDYRSNNNTNYPLRIGAASSVSGTSVTFAAQGTTSVNAGVIQTVTVDISQLTGNYYIALRGTVAIRVYSIYLE